jgi:hypothetical protein
METTVLEHSILATVMKDPPIARSADATWRWRIALRTVRWSIINALFMATYGLGLLFEPDSFHGPVFQVARSMLELHGWAWLMLTIGVLYVATAWTRLVQLYVLTQAASITLSTTWLAALLIARLQHGAPLTWGGVALWLFYITTNISASQQPHQAVPTACKR